MVDNQRLSDAELAARVAAHDPELAKLIRARLRRLRLERLVTPEQALAQDVKRAALERAH